jgi:tetratricopeptide (TPR) repeat protein
MKDRWGNPLSYGDAQAVEGYCDAVWKLHGYKADAVAHIDEVLAAHPDFVMAHCYRAAAFATAMDKAFEDEARQSLTAAEALAARAHPRERAYMHATGAWIDGDFDAATEGFGRIAIAWPRDLLAVQLAHAGDFFLGYSHMLRDRVARVLPAWSATDDGYGFLMGMYAFGLEESGDYDKAEAAGRDAVRRNPEDGWAVHAVAHVMEMQGRSEDGVRWLHDTEAGWLQAAGFAYHNWWHKALFHLDRAETSAVFDIYDRHLAAATGQALELVDATAMLWRLIVLGHDAGARWSPVAQAWAERADHGHYAFNDAHAAMAFASMAAATDQDRQMLTLQRAAESSQVNGMMSRQVGLPAARGFAAFGRGDYAAAIAHLMPLRGIANRFGGSHAQRDVFLFTLSEAAIRAGEKPLAEALAAERLAAKPGSALNRAWAQRAAGLARAAAAE